MKKYFGDHCEDPWQYWTPPQKKKKKKILVPSILAIPLSQINNGLAKNRLRYLILVELNKILLQNNFSIVFPDPLQLNASIFDTADGPCYTLNSTAIHERVDRTYAVIMILHVNDFVVANRNNYEPSLHESQAIGQCSRYDFINNHFQSVNLK